MKNVCIVLYCSVLSPFSCRQLSTDISHVKLVVVWNCMWVERWKGVRTNISTCQRPLFPVCCYCVIVIICNMSTMRVTTAGSSQSVLPKWYESNKQTNKETNKKQRNCALLGCYAASSGNFLPTFRDNLTVPSSWPLKMGSIVCAETSVRNYHYSLRKNPEERSSHLLRGGSLKSQTDKGLNERRNVTA